MRVSIIGNCASSNYVGIGGVSIHVLRLGAALYERNELNRVYNTVFIQRKELKKNNRSYTPSYINNFYNTKNLPWITLLPSFKNAHLNLIAWFFRYILFDRAKILHIHNELPFCYLFFLLNKYFKKKIIFTIHDQMTLVKVIKSSAKEYYFLKLLLNNKAIKWIAVNDTISEQLVVLGVAPLNIEVIPAYIAAKDEGVELSKETQQYFASHKPNLFFYAFAIKQLNGVDLYGLDMALESIKYLKNDFPEIGLFILIPDANNDSKFEKYVDYVKENSLQNNIKFYHDVIPDLNVIWDKTDIYVRPTCSDGDSLTVREALHKNVKVVVSNVVERPESCVLFKNRDIVDMVKVLKDTINNFDAIKEIKPFEKDDFLNRILKVYKSFDTKSQMLKP